MENYKDLLKQAASFLNHPANGQSVAHEEAATELRTKIDAVLNPDRPLTYGMKMVGLTFNPSGLKDVNDIKEAAAALIDVMDRQRCTGSVTKQQFEFFTDSIKMVLLVQMLGVKAATWKD